jgi:uncharacterized membrane protein
MSEKDPKPTDEDKNGLTNAFVLFHKSKELVLKNPMPFAVLYLFPLIIGLLQSFNGNGFGFSSPGASFNISAKLFTGFFVGTFIFAIVSVIVQIMLVRLVLFTAEGKTPTLDELWPSVRKYGLRFVGLSIVVGLLTVGGLILFIVPGVIIFRRYFLAVYYLVDEDISITEAMNRSASDSKPISYSIWSIIGVTLLLAIPSILPVIGSVISTALALFYSVAPALRYYEIRKLKRHMIK